MKATFSSTSSKSKCAADAVRTDDNLLDHSAEVIDLGFCTFGESFGEGIDLVKSLKWVHIAPERGYTPEQILDSRLSTISFAWTKQMPALH
ncbi:hypothetical protein C5167_046676 [Papaver somniferum]|uniref:Uncharacterized protein n=1 Tax=Papaver somniferum TaxID=3469 RepID=A0A4Y7LGY0_PAPSO|nr:hypothetical protein C5167_046676 [Papaver somniferum]